MYHSYLTTVRGGVQISGKSAIFDTKIGTGLPYYTAKNQYPAAYKTATVMPNRSLCGIPISTSLKQRLVFTIPDHHYIDTLMKCI